MSKTATQTPADMSGNQAVHIESYAMKSIDGVGFEQTRTPESRCANDAINVELTHQNIHLKAPTHRHFSTEWQRVYAELQKSGVTAKRQNDARVHVMDSIVITSGPEFFASLGWKAGDGVTDRVRAFFEDAYAWTVADLGFRGTDANVLAATIHVDEGTPHMHVSFIPVAERQKLKVYEKAAGKKGRGHLVKDEKGQQVFKVENRPSVSHTQFFTFYGDDQSDYATGRQNGSYALLQDRFQAAVGEKWRLYRGERGSNAVHKSKLEWEIEQAKAQRDSVKAETQERLDAAAQREIAVAQGEADLAAARDEHKEHVIETTLRQQEAEAKIAFDQSELAAAQAAHVAEKRAVADREREADERSSQLDLRETALKDRETDVSDRNAVLLEQERAQQDRERAWSDGEHARSRQLAEHDGAIARRKEVADEILAQARRATATDYTSMLPAGKTGLGGRVSYSADENARLQRLAHDAMLHEEPIAEVKAQKKLIQKMQTQITALQPEAARVPQLLQERDAALAAQRTAVQELAVRNQTIERMQSEISGLKRLVARIAGFAVRILRGLGAERVADHIVQHLNDREHVDIVERMDRYGQHMEQEYEREQQQTQQTQQPQERRGLADRIAEAERAADAIRTAKPQKKQKGYER